MAALTSSTAQPNPAARLAVVLGTLAVAAIPLGVLASRYAPTVTLLQALYVAVPAAIVSGYLAVRAARRGRETITRTLGRAGGQRAAAIGRGLALAGMYFGAMGAIALVSYTLLHLYS